MCECVFLSCPVSPSRRIQWETRLKPLNRYDILECSTSRSAYSRSFYRKKAVPTAISTGLDIGLSNLSLKTITLSFYSERSAPHPYHMILLSIMLTKPLIAMCKSSSLVFVLAFAFLFHLETFSIRLIGVILLISTGVLLMVATETHFVLGGFILVLSASALGGLRWSLTQLLMRSKRSGMNHPVATIFWLTPVMGLTIAIVSLSIESWSQLWGSRFFDGTSATLRTIGLLILPGIIAFSMVLSEY